MKKEPARPVLVYDTTLRDGTQGEDVNFSLEDKLRIAEKLDELGVHFIEGGWPSVNPKDLKFFSEISARGLQKSKLVAFGSTRRKGLTPGQDQQLKGLAKLPVKIVSIVGKSWELHIRDVLHTGLGENLKMIHETVDYLVNRGKTVFFDAEHFFDGFRESRSYSLDCIAEAVEAGASLVCLCDTNGGALPLEVAKACREVLKLFPVSFGIHAHNDGGLAVANSLLAVQEGVEMVQGTVNGFGERCGNADLCALLANLSLKLGRQTIPGANLKKIRELSHLAWELTNRPPDNHQPFVGDSAFAHKGGQHIDAVLKNSRSYEHIDPALVGNRRRILVSDQAGKSTILAKSREFGLKLDRNNPVVRAALAELKKLESQGYEFEGAEASFELLLQKARGGGKTYFKFKGFRVTDEKRPTDKVAHAEATIMVEVEGQGVEHTAAEGVGPVNALDNALRKALERFYPSLKEVQLVDYKVRVLPAKLGTASQVRVLVESTDGKDHWGTVGVSDNIIEASWQALIDSVVYKLYKDGKKRNREHAGKGK
jgi:2-isopropylmalate synthase